jgi:MFS transporter, SP family, arabinose:H+ symporter
MQQLTGINAIVTQANNLVSKVIPDLSDYCGLTINVLQFLATFCTIYVLTKVGRKSLTLFGNLALGLIDIAIGVLFIFDKSTAYGYTIFGLLILYNIIYGISLGPVVWLYVPEIIPAKIVPLATMMNWIGCSICVVFMPIAIDANDGNPYPVFLFFGCITLVFFLVNFMTMIETKGLSVKQIAKRFHE